MADREGLKRVNAALIERTRGPATAKYRQLGTPANLLSFDQIGVLPSYNFRQSTFEGAEQLSGEELHQVRLAKVAACASCTVGCEHLYRTLDQDDATATRLEYESMFALGPMLGIGDPDVVIRTASLCDRLGLDSISTGGTLAWAMECYGRGLLTAADTGVTAVVSTGEPGRFLIATDDNKLALFDAAMGSGILSLETGASPDRYRGWARGGRSPFPARHPAAHTGPRRAAHARGRPRSRPHPRSDPGSLTTPVALPAIGVLDRRGVLAPPRCPLPPALPAAVWALIPWPLARRRRSASTRSLPSMQKAERLTQLPPYLFVQIRQKIREARERGIDVISLGVGDPDQPTPSHVIEALARAAADPANHQYPTDEERGMLAFREAVAAWYQRRFGVALDPASEVLALIGSKEGNHHLALGVLNPGDVAIVPDPGYPAYLASAIFAGAELVRLPLDPSRGFLLDFSAVPSDLARRTRLLWLNYPNNPTAAVAPLSFYQEAVEFARQHDIVLANDNPYSEIAYEGLRTHSVLEADGAREVAIEFNSLSKPYNMTGWRIGMAVGNRDLIAAVAQVKENTDSGVFNAIQYAGIAALEGPQDVVEQNIRVYQRRRDLVVDTLRAVGLRVEPPAATFYVWAPLPEGTQSIDFAARLLERTGVVVTPGIGYGSQGEGYIRLSLTVPDARLDEAMHRIHEARQSLLVASGE